MVDNPASGAGGIVDGAAKSKAVSTADSGTATVGKASEQGASSAASGAQSPETDAVSGGQQGGAPGAPGLSLSPGVAAALPALGAGGTSAAPKPPGEGDGVVPGEGKNDIAKGTLAAASIPVANAAGQMLVLMMFLKWLKGLLMQMAAMIMNLFNMFMAAMLASIKAVVGFFMGIGAAVSSALGGLVSAAAAGAASFFAGVAAVAVAVVSAVVGLNATNEVAQRDGVVSCVVPAQAALTEVEGEEGNADQITLANAKTIFSVFKAWGMSDENIAGILGNWQLESGIDPTSVQDNPEPRHQMSDHKKSVAQNTDNGIGLGQWTYGRNAKLRDYASGIGKNWWTIETQLGFMVSADNPGSVDIAKDMIQNSLGTPKAAALHFHRVWEVSDDGQDGLDRRSNAATEWMGKFGGWTANKTLADSILKQANTTLSSANSNRSEDIRDECHGVGEGSLALKEGGLTLEEAKRLMDDYIANGEAFLRARYPGKGQGPGDCNNSKSDNCVGFSTYFMNKFTSFQGYANGDGFDLAAGIAAATNHELTKVPTVYSVVSGPGSTKFGHTFVVLGIQGDQAVIGEASCGSNHKGTKARLMPLSKLTDGSWDFVDVSDIITAEPAS